MIIYVLFLFIMGCSVASGHYELVPFINTDSPVNIDIYDNGEATISHE